MLKFLLPVIFVIGILSTAVTFKKAEHPFIIDPAYTVDTLAMNLTVPWAITFLDASTMLFTERSGKVRLMKNDSLSDKPLLCLSETNTTKKMGLLGLCLHPQFAKNHLLYLAYNYTPGKNAFLRVVRYRMQADTLLDATIIIDSIEANQNHTGCRLKFGPDNKLYITSGDADRPALAQDLKALNGKIIRLNDDGTIPADNPFVNNDTANKAIWSYGHRNPQGIDFHPATNQLYDSEHGPTGGDEINLILKVTNYGWPVIHHDDTHPGMISPLYQYTPSIGPSEILFYRGNCFPQLKGKMLMASLRGQSITIIDVDGKKIGKQRYILHNDYGRIRALAESPDGTLYFSTSLNDPPEGNGKPGYDMLLRLRPSGRTAKNVIDFELMPPAEIKKQTLGKTTLQLYSELCASCHGQKMAGTKRAQTMLDNEWKFGATKQEIMKSISHGIVDQGMPAWQGAISNEQVSALADLILKFNNSAIRKTQQ